VKWVRRDPWFLTGWLWYLGTLVPVIGIVPQAGDQIMADRYVYLPLVGLWVAAVWTAAGAIGKRLPVLHAAAIVSLLWLGALAATAARQATYWADSRTLFKHALTVTGGNYVMANNLGVVLARQPGEAAQAMALFRQALAFAPFHAAAHANLGGELMKSGQWDEARKHLETAVRLNPSLAAPQADLGILMAAEGDYQAALRRFEESLRLNPEQPEARNNICGVLLQLRRPAEAAAHCTEALKARPDYAKARVNLARALALQGQREEAERELNLVLRRNPNDSGARQALVDLRAAAVRNTQ
jgi:protein O-mannosyl-transferase